MKLHLPVRLFHAIITVITASGLYSEAQNVPAKFQDHIVDFESMADFTDNIGKTTAFLLDGSVRLDETSAVPIVDDYSKSTWYITGKGEDEAALNIEAFKYSRKEEIYLESLASNPGLFVLAELNVSDIDSLNILDNSLEFAATSAVNADYGLIRTKNLYFSDIAKIDISNNNVTGISNGGYVQSYGGALNGKTTFESNDSIRISNNKIVSDCDVLSKESIDFHTQKIEWLKEEWEKDTSEGKDNFIENCAGGDSFLAFRYKMLIENFTSVPSTTDTQSYALGGGHYGEAVTYKNNGSIEFDGNGAIATGYTGLYQASGGAIYSSKSITLESNASVNFQNNFSEIRHKGDGYDYQTTLRGGAITLFVTFGEDGILDIRNNETVLFEKNYLNLNGKYKLESVYCGTSHSYCNYEVSLSSPEGASIEFRDSAIFDNCVDNRGSFSPEVHLNSVYTDSEGNEISQTGDIIFNGGYAEQHLNEILAARGENRTATAEEVLASQTSEIKGTATLHDGRLIVKDGAVLKVDTLVVKGSASGESTTTVELENAEISGNDTLARTASLSTLSFEAGTRFVLRGFNTVNTSALNVAKGATLDIYVTEEHADKAAMSSSSDLGLAGAVTLHLLQGCQTLGAGSYRLFELADEDAAAGITFNVTGMDADIIIGDDGVITMVLEETVSILDDMSDNQLAAHEAAGAIAANGEVSGLLKEMVTLATESLDREEVAAILNELSGCEYASAMSSQLEGNLAHLRHLRAAAGTGLPLSVTPAVEPDEKGEVVEVGNTRRWGAGISVFHDETSVDRDARGEGYDRSETGAMLTVDCAVKDSLTLGVAVSQSRTNLRPDYGKRRHEDNTHIDFYGVYRSGRWSAVSALGLGLHKHDMERTVAGLNAGAETDGYSVNLLQEVAYTTWQNEKNSVQVYGAIESSLNHIDGFRESGADTASLHVGNLDAWATDVTVGVRWNHGLTPLGSAPAGIFSFGTGMVASLGDLKDTARMSYVGAPGAAFHQDSATRNRWGWEVSATLQLPVSESASIYGAAETVLRGDSFSVDGQVGVKYVF